SPAPKPDVSLFDLINAVSSVLARIAQRDESRDVFADKWTVSEKIDHLIKLMKERPRLRFSELFADNTSRVEVVVTFLALLELIRLKVLPPHHPEPFSEIEIGATSPEALSAHATPNSPPEGTPAT